MIEDLRLHLTLGELDEESLQRLTRHAVCVRLEEGEVLFRQGDPATRFYLVRHGQIKLFRLSPSGNEKVIDIVLPGSTFAEALVFLERPHYPVGAEALQASEVISLDAVDFADMLKGSVDTCFALLGNLSMRLRSLLREIDELSLHSATCRVAAYLIKHAPTQSNTFRLPVAKQTVAARLSVKPETLSRIVKNFSEKGVLDVSGSWITIRDRDALRATAAVCSSGIDEQ